MRTARSILLGIVFLVLMIGLVQNASADPIRVLGIDTTSAWDYSTISTIANVAFTEVGSAAFAGVDLYQYDVLLVSETFLDGGVQLPAQATLTALKAREAYIGAWIMAGHGVVALSEPNGNTPYDWLPDAVQPTTGAMLHDDTVGIVAPLHPVMAGLTSNGLSGWGTSSHGNFTFYDPSGLDVLVDDNGTGRAITLAGSYGLGRLVLTLQDPDYHNYYSTRKPDQITFVRNAIQWASQPEPVPEPATMLLLGSGLVGLAGFRKRFRKN